MICKVYIRDIGRDALARWGTECNYSDNRMDCVEPRYTQGDYDHVTNNKNNVYIVDGPGRWYVSKSFYDDN